MRLPLVCIAVFVLAGCDTQEARPITLAERVAGRWEVTGVQDGNTTVTRRFMDTVGSIEIELASVGCCAGNAAYRFAVSPPGGEVIETDGRYEANDNPNDADDFIIFVTEGGVFALQFAYDFNASYSEMTLTALREADEMVDAFSALGVDFPFQERVVFELDRLD